MDSLLVCREHHASRRSAACKPQVFCAQTLHHPPDGTLCPTKILHPPVASPALPWNWAQVPHFWPGLNVGLAEAFTLLPSGTKLSDLAVGSFGSSGVIPCASAVRIRPSGGTSAPASKLRLTMARREILCCMDFESCRLNGPTFSVFFCALSAREFRQPPIDNASQFGLSVSDVAV